ncbi:hypothetical protein FA95DRAFT_1557697 [Auriscalpium vulgare]|uniref:Uncharacterized protein n=1 Tax=Auriscalpium vulgare TaxID=40419 RepID=A0ACB8RXI0_9AGAM|nr:hypothetical protein FA95DRAFT_1557697 [Auriscalpium vulgare]
MSSTVSDSMRKIIQQIRMVYDAREPMAPPPLLYTDPLAAPPSAPVLDVLQPPAKRPLSPLPTPPPQTGKDSYALIGDAELAEYVEPLYARAWGMRNRAGLLRLNGRPCVTLYKDFKFPTDVMQFEFLNMLGKKIVAFRHHPELAVTWMKVTFITTSHEAVSHESDTARRRLRGVTARDVQLAYSAEKIYAGLLKRASLSYNQRLLPKSQRPQTIKEIISERGA